MEIKAKKSLGQNFLEDEKILDDIIANCNVTQEDLVIEIGPGKGALTKRLKSFNCDLIAFEIDERMISILKKLENDKTSIIFEDFLKVDLEKYINKQYRKIHIIANIPYYITSLIIKKVLESKIIVDEMILMVQKEVADRLSASCRSKAYGSLTVYCNVNYDVKKLFNVDKTCFNPVPKVDSAIVKFIRADKYNIKNMEVFEKLINDSFALKRKTLKNNLKAYDWNEIYDILKVHGYTENVRAEEIPVNIFVLLANYMAK
ncbi:MAG: ribosomal RNA small subunit methyltransferase A [Bacilli bacterium]|nr:ribosomal RNA small subunit methyltransferase A [Bacilli bacterium]